MDKQKYLGLLNENYIHFYGKVVKVVGLTVESTGVDAKINDTCDIILKDTGKRVLCEVVGFRDDRLLLMPYEDVGGVSIGDCVEATGTGYGVPVGNNYLGMVFDGLGRPMDGTSVEPEDYYRVERPDPQNPGQVPSADCHYLLPAHQKRNSD